MSASDLPTEWIMCREDEAKDREIHKEISKFESVSCSSKSPCELCKGHSQLCIKKYRRSAAGSSVGSYRMLSALNITVRHLLKTILSYQKSHDEMEYQSLIETANFVNHRLRAVQVDFSHHLENSKNMIDEESFTSMYTMQANMVRYHILLSYLLSEVPNSKFEHAFNRKALQVAFTNFFELFKFCNVANLMNGLVILDEILCYYALIQISLKLTNCDSSEFSTILVSNFTFFDRMLKNKKKEITANSFPKWMWSIQVGGMVLNGNYIKIFHLLEDIESCSWKAIACCCLSQCFFIFRVELVSFWNKSFAKNESVSNCDLSRLLYMSPESAIKFCANLGLPKGCNESSILFKSKPVVMKPRKIISREDKFVLNISNYQEFGRIDEDNVYIPSPKIIWQLISGT